MIRLCELYASVRWNWRNCCSPFRLGDVVASIVDALKSKGPFLETERKDFVADQLLARGKSRVGLALRFSEALADSKFVCDNDGVVSLPTKTMAG